MRVAGTGTVCDAPRNHQCAATETATQFGSPEVEFRPSGTARSAACLDTRFGANVLGAQAGADVVWWGGCRAFLVPVSAAESYPGRVKTLTRGSGFRHFETRNVRKVTDAHLADWISAQRSHQTGHRHACVCFAWVGHVSLCMWNGQWRPRAVRWQRDQCTRQQHHGGVVRQRVELAVGEWRR
jgi:hypothetical protein